MHVHVSSPFASGLYVWYTWYSQLSYMLKRCGAVRRLLVMGTKERVGACEELLGYWNGVNG